MHRIWLIFTLDHEDLFSSELISSASNRLIHKEYAIEACNDIHKSKVLSTGR